MSERVNGRVRVWDLPPEEETFIEAVGLMEFTDLDEANEDVIIFSQQSGDRTALFESQLYILGTLALASLGCLIGLVYVVFLR